MESRFFENANTIVIKVNIGEHVLACIKKALKDENFKGFGQISAIGAVRNVHLGYMLDSGKYLEKTFYEHLEITSLAGNVTYDREYKIHLHGTFGKTNFQVVGGHFFDGVCTGTVEVFVRIIDKQGLSRVAKKGELFPCLNLESK